MHIYYVYYRYNILAGIPTELRDINNVKNFNKTIPTNSQRNMKLNIKKKKLDMKLM